MTPVTFVSLDVFHRLVRQLGKALAVFIRNLKRLLPQAMSNPESAACDRLLLHQCLVALLATVSRQLQVVEEVKILPSGLSVPDGQGIAWLAIRHHLSG